MERENTKGFEEGYKCVKKTKDKIDPNQMLCSAAKTMGDRYGDKEGEKA